ncbi:Signal transduction histidine kinase [Pelagirhabdus alkalitolerans]|uniref:Heme sensor protein HssS n=1 Tax=Pelagirhabdus alkalitolerans TaxID=1612202 RepID=A0A1G6MR60_9BACI|nr:HAMP domain-containing sensor histidine kinase [Pelagirhabdus alkalitolerans]SDC58078.1 Signal transduction histidine kinase [Pelagirhabdus alkalitolerans]
MRRSLYWQFVTTFITGVILSLVLSYGITSIFFQSEVIHQEEMEDTSQYVVELLDMVDTDDLPRLLDLLNDFGVEAVILDETDEPYLPNMNTEFITEEMVDQINANETSEITTFTPGRRDLVRYIGTPVDYEGERFTLFVKMNFEDEFAGSRRLTLNALILVLIIGSVFIILVSRYFVSSIRSITDAAEQLKMGDFNVQLKSEREDEVGRLIRSFNQMAESLKNMDEVRKTFVSNVSHEIQSPLTSIKGYARALVDGVVKKEDEHDYMMIIYKEADRLSRLSDHLLRMASLDSDKHPVKKAPYRLDEQIRRVILSTEMLWQEKDLEIKLDLTDDVIEADQDLMEQVWLNLIVNAIKYNHADGEIHVSNYEEDIYRVVRVSDRGIGIPDDSIPYLFDRFYQVDQSRTKTRSGNGLGLSIVQRIVALHGGYIDVISEEGVGTTFFVYLPKK